MSIPRFDPNFTMDQLRQSGDRLMDAAYDYWEDAHRAGISGACIWVQDSDGRLVIFTRGEYRETLMRNIDRIGSSRQFGAAGDDNEEARK